jgi:sulfite reductase (NADPH) flavoprotein alpha-component
MHLSKGDDIDCSNVKFAVVGLGDREYELFCEFGKRVDAALEKHGGTRIMDRLDLDAEYEMDYASWSKKLFETIQSA